MVIEKTFDILSIFLNIYTTLNIFLTLTLIEPIDLRQFKYKIRCLNLSYKLHKIMTLQDEYLYKALIILSKKVIDLKGELKLSSELYEILKDLSVYSDRLEYTDRCNKNDCDACAHKLISKLSELVWISTPTEPDETQISISKNIAILLITFLINIITIMF